MVTESGWREEWEEYHLMTGIHTLGRAPARTPPISEKSHWLRHDVKRITIAKLAVPKSHHHHHLATHQTSNLTRTIIYHGQAPVPRAPDGSAVQADGRNQTQKQEEEQATGTR
jgi:hypothetical protein